MPSSLSHDFLNDALLSDEVIIEAMTLSERPWEDNHHQSSILPPLSEEDPPLTSMTTKDGLACSPSTSYGISTVGNLRKLLKTITINILVKPKVMESITIGAKCTQEEITLYKALFTKFHDIFSWSYEECLASTLGL